jgi:hypothetical protein
MRQLRHGRPEAKALRLAGGRQELPAFERGQQAVEGIALHTNHVMPCWRA